MSDTIIPIAYVTKWATTKGIVIVRDAEATESGSLHKSWRLHVMSHDWTESKDLAESRWRLAVQKAAASALKKAERLSRIASGAPVYAREQAKEGR